MNWFSEHRQAWIFETLQIFGFINRHHLVCKFGISVPQASSDLQRFMRSHPGQISYDKSLKRYVTSPGNPYKTDD